MENLNLLRLMKGTVDSGILREVAGRMNFCA